MKGNIDVSRCDLDFSRKLVYSRTIAVICNLWFVVFIYIHIGYGYDYAVNPAMAFPLVTVAAILAAPYYRWLRNKQFAIMVHRSRLRM